MPHAVYDRIRASVTLRGWLVVIAVLVAVVPVAIGWSAQIGGAIVVAAPLLLWLLWAPAGRAATIVGLVLFGWYVLGWAMTVVAETMLTPVYGMDVLAGYSPVALAVVLAGIGFLAAARRQMANVRQDASTGEVATPPPATRSTARTWRYLVTAVLLVPCCLLAVAPLAGFASFEGVSEPTSSDVLLPPGTRIVGTETDCGSTGQFCFGEFMVESYLGGGSDLATQVAAHWTRLGWSAVAPCRFKGIVDRTELCWFVTAVDADTARVIIQHAELRDGRTTPATIPG